MNKKFLTYRGELKAVATWAKNIAFTTVHEEGLPTALYRLNPEKIELDEIPLDCGGLCLATAGENLWLSGDNGQIYHIKGKAKKLSALSTDLPSPTSALCVLANDRIAAICDDTIVVFDSNKGTTLQTLSLAEKATAIAADPTGIWFAVGTSKGDVSVFECEDKDEYQISDSAKLHDASVTSILFEPEELRFFSAGADQKLLLTHARGTLEPEDRGRGASHSDHVTAMLHVPGERFITTSRDKTCKTWARVGATRPATFDDAVPKVVNATLVDIHNRPHLVIAGSDNSLRFILVDAGGRFGSMTTRIYDAYSRAKHLLDSNDISQRGEAIHALAEYDDGRAVEILAKTIDEDDDAGLRLKAAELLAKSQHAKTRKLLEPLLAHKDDKVRLAIFKGLCDTSAADDLRPLELAIAAEQANIGIAAIERLEPKAKTDDQARQLLIRTLNNDPPEVRETALLSLEAVFDKTSPEPTRIAAKSNQSDTRRLALIRAFQRKLLNDSRVAGVVRRSGEDRDADVRRTAFLVALLSRTKLAKAIRDRDKELHRQLFEIEQFDLKPKKGSKAKEPPKTKPGKFSLSDDDYEPLLSAMSARATDTCLLGARCLALLGDARAFGTLLQLSREQEATARVQVCQALAALNDPRASQRLESLVNDDAVAVRDAAYTALENLYESSPLIAAEMGLASAHVEVRRRALKTLSTTMRKAKGKYEDDARDLMLRALNDSEDSVSGEAFKTSLNLKIDGTPEATLRFTLNSVRVNVRREALTETMAQDKEEWGQQLLIDLLNDAAPQVRVDAYEHILSKSKGRDVAKIQTGLASRYADVRLSATKSLIRRKTKAAQEALLTAIDDDDEDVRLNAIKALINFNAVEIVQKAMESRHTDVRLQAACARALFQDPQAKTPLTQTATATKPENEAEIPIWEKHAAIALNGLGLLGEVDSLPDLLPLLDSDNETIRKSAATAISRCARPEAVESLREPLQHADPNVRFRVALGLAYCQDSIALPVVFSDDATEILGEAERLQAAVAYGKQTETTLASLLDSQESWIGNAAFLILLFRDWKNNDGTPTRIMAALSAQQARIRLAAAGALVAFSDPNLFGEFIVEFLNDRGDEKPWEVPAEQVDAIANLIAHGEPFHQAQATTILQTLSAKDQDDWNFAFDVHSARYAEDATKQPSTSGKTKTGKAKTSKAKTNSDELLELAFGTYVGIVRQQGGHRRGGFGTSPISIRQTAIRRLVTMATTNDSLAAATQSILTQVLGDRSQAVRMLAFEQLETLGVDDQSRAEVGIECGHLDLAVLSLKLLSGGAKTKGKKVLEDVILSRDDSLATEAGELLLEMTDAVTAAKIALESPHSRTRTLAVGWLAADYDENAKAKKALVAAYGSRYDVVQREVAMRLANKKDKAALEMLLEQLPAASTARIQERLAASLVELGDPQTPIALLDLLENDTESSLDSPLIFRSVASFRDPSVIERLLQLFEKPEWQNDVASSIITISGHDQYIRDPDDRSDNRDWMNEQHPRHDEVLASYFSTCIDLNLPNLILPYIPAARWSLSKAIDPFLKQLSLNPDEAMRHAAVEAIGWRLKKRDGKPDALKELLESRDPATRFLAAEGLARGGHDDGIAILLSAVELLPDLNDRARAVRALGELGDERALDILLKLVSEDGHVLQPSAAEAIGHLGKSEKADEILAILTRLASVENQVAERAFVGLRWFDTPSGWELLRQKAKSDNPLYFHTLVEQFGYNDTPETRELLLDLLHTTWPDNLLPPARKVFGENSLEPDYAALQSENSYYPHSYLEEKYHCLQRVCERGDAERIFEILPNTTCHEELGAAIMQRNPLPMEAAAKAFEDGGAQSVELAAAIVGKVAKKEHAKPIGPTLKKWVTKWNETYEDESRTGYDDYYEIEPIAKAICRMAWAAGRNGTAKSELLQLVQENHEIPQFAIIRRAAINALSICKLTKAELTALVDFAQDYDNEVREVAAEILAQQDAAKASKLTSDLVSDRDSFRRIMKYSDVKVIPVIDENADHANYQAIVLPQLVANADVKRLADVAANADLGESTRLGAVEGLARIASAAGDKHLVNIGTNESAGEEIQKAAWRGLRRSRRTQAGGSK